MPIVAAAGTDLSHRYGELAIRTLWATGVVALLLLLRPNDVPLVLLAAVIFMSLDLRNFGSLRNFFLAYSFLLFGVGGDLLHFTDVPVLRDALFYTCAFLIGYVLSSVPQESLADRRSRGGSSYTYSEERILRAMAALAVVSFGLLLYELSRYGVIGYYRGQPLVDQFLAYGKADSAGGAEQILRFGLTYSSVGLVIIYVQACLEEGRTIRYRYPVGLLVVTPILFLHRFEAVVGAATLVGIYCCDRRLSGATMRPSGRRSGPGDQGNRRIRLAAVAAGIGVAFSAALVIGSLRQLPGRSNSVTTKALLTEEFATVQAYTDIKTNRAALGHPDGTTIILPLLLKVVPRGRGIPTSLSIRVPITIPSVHPQSYAAGFQVPSTIFGDALLSFGFVGALVFFLVLGFVNARSDIGYKKARLSRIPVFLIAFANYYPLLYSPLSEGLAGILLALVVWARGPVRCSATRPILAPDWSDRVVRRGDDGTRTHDPLRARQVL